jgi:hypothetical protein
MYTSWYSTKSEIRYGADSIEIRHKHFLSSQYLLQKNAQKLGTIRFYLLGNLQIDLHFPGQSPTKYTLKSKGVFKRRFELYNAKKQKIMEMRPIFKWKMLRSNYEIEWFPEWTKHPNRIELSCLAGFGVHLYNRATSASTGAGT